MNPKGAFMKSKPQINFSTKNNQTVIKVRAFVFNEILIDKSIKNVSILEPITTTENAITLLIVIENMSHKELDVCVDICKKKLVIEKIWSF